MKVVGAVKMKEVPQLTRQRTSKYESVFDSLKKLKAGQACKIELGEGESPRVIVPAIRSLAKERLGRKLVSRVDGQVLYVWLK